LEETLALNVFGGEGLMSHSRISFQFVFVAITCLAIGCSGNGESKVGDLNNLQSLVGNSFATPHDDGVVGHDNITLRIVENVTALGGSYKISSSDGGNDGLSNANYAPGFWVAEIPGGSRAIIYGQHELNGSQEITTFTIELLSDDPFDQMNFLRLYKMNVNQNESPQGQCNQNVTGILDFGLRVGPLLNLAILKKFADKIDLPVETVLAGPLGLMGSLIKPLPVVYHFSEKVDAMIEMETFMHDNYPTRIPVNDFAIPSSSCLSLGAHNAALAAVATVSAVGSIININEARVYRQLGFNPHEFLESSEYLPDFKDLVPWLASYSVFQLRFDDDFIDSYLDQSGFASASGRADFNTKIYMDDEVKFFRSLVNYKFVR
jgi:hypothetical protein